MVQEYYENQDRTDQVSIKPGLKVHLKDIAKTVFPCAKVGPEDALEYLVSVYLKTNEIQEKQEQKVGVFKAPTTTQIPAAEYEYSQPDNPVISNIVGVGAPPDEIDSANEIDFGSDL